MKELGLTAAISDWAEEQIQRRFGIAPKVSNHLDEADERALDDLSHALLFRSTRDLEADDEIVGEVEDGKDMVRAAVRQRPDVIVVDISMPNLNGLEAIEAQLLGTVAEILLADDEGPGRSTPRKRYLACRRAIGCVEGLKKPMTVPELAATVGVSARVLELSFNETLGISPRKYMRWNRMNLLHRDLRAARRDDTTVTELANRWGFHELGRTAVEYGQLFGESPSGTLARNPRVAAKRLSDMLLE